MSYILISLVASLIVSMVFLPWILKLCYRKRLFDSVNDRKVHQLDIPRLGGVVFLPSTVIGILVALVCMRIFDNGFIEIFHFNSIIIALGIAIIYAIGLIDDIIEIPANIKFLFQIIVAAMFPICGLYINNLYGFCGIYEIPFWISYAITLFVALLIINAINLIDGIDGLAAGLSLVALFIFGYYFYEIKLYVICITIAGLAGSLLAYIPYNIFGSVKRKTKTFMGDSGSLLLGISLTYFALKFSMDKSPSIPPRTDALLISYTALLIPCFDLCRVAICRLRRGQGIFSPDKTHIHHKFISKGFSIRPTLCIILGIQMLFFVINASLHYAEMEVHWILLIDILLYTALHIWLPVTPKER